MDSSGLGSRRIFVPGVRAILLNGAGEILLQRPTDNGQWEISGGFVELDETPLEALRREVEEETSLKVIEAERMGFSCGPHQKFAYPTGDRVQCFALAFIVRKGECTPRADGREGSMIQFFQTSRLTEDLVPVHRATIEDYLRYDGKFLLSG